MNHLNVRITPDDEASLSVLIKTWGVDRSTATRKALAFAATHVEQTRKSKLQILKEYSLIGSYSDGSRKSHKTRVKESIRKKYRKK